MNLIRFAEPCSMFSINEISAAKKVTSCDKSRLVENQLRIRYSTVPNTQKHANNSQINLTLEIQIFRVAINKADNTEVDSHRKKLWCNFHVFACN